MGKISPNNIMVDKHAPAPNSHVGELVCLHAHSCISYSDLMTDNTLIAVLKSIKKKNYRQIFVVLEQHQNTTACKS